MSEQRVSEHYLGETGAQYTATRQRDAGHIGFQLNLAYFRPYLEPTDTVLDFGCGNGGMLRLLQDIVARADGLEVNPAPAAVARESGLTVYGGLDEIPSAPLYDAIVSNHVLEHVRDVPGTLEQLGSHLRPGGLFVTKLPVDDPNARYQRGWSKDDVDHHLQTWSPRLFANTLYEAGFDVRESRVITSAWHPKLFPLVRLGLGRPAFWAFAVLRRRRQLFAVGARR